jgi:hypothetical protein
MPYTKVGPFTNGLPPAISADHLNMMETQYDQAMADAAATFVVFRNHDGTPVAAPKVVVITLTADGTDIDNIAVYASLAGVGH